MAPDHAAGVTTVLRVMTGAALVGLALVGAFEMRSALLSVLLAVGAFGFVLAVMSSWQNGVTGRPLWARAARLALAGTAVPLVFVGSMVVLGGFSALLGVAMLLGWWVLRQRRRAAEPPPREAEPAPPAHVQPGRDRDGMVVVRLSGAQEDQVVLRLDPERLDELAHEVERLIRSLDGATLVRVWAACRDGGDPGDAAQRFQLVKLRQMVLDEIERRDPEAFASWLARGAPDDPPVRG